MEGIRQFHDAHWIGGWVGPRAGLDTAVARSETTAASKKRTPVLQHVASNFNG
jgi:hypothetical protein